MTNRKPITISIEFDNGDIIERPIEDVDEEYRNNIIEDLEHAESMENNRRQLRALGFLA